MEKFLAVFRVRTKKGAHRYGYTWLKKRNRAKVMETVTKRTQNDEVITEIWSTVWQDENYKYTKEYGALDQPEQDFVPMVRGQAKWRQKGKGFTERVKEEVKKEETKVYVPKAYVIKTAEFKEEPAA